MSGDGRDGKGHTFLILGLLLRYSVTCEMVDFFEKTRVLGVMDHMVGLVNGKRREDMRLVLFLSKLLGF